MHRPREDIDARVPLHVTIRLKRGIPSIRQPRFVRRLRVSLCEACVRHGFRIVHYSVQRDHVHLLVEAQNNRSIACGMKSVGARLGKLANRLFERRGQVLDGRYHLRPLRTPLEVRRALRYVLLNHRHHAAQRRGARPSNRRAGVLDPASSARWFDGWCISTPSPNEAEICEVASARTWLLRIGWRRHGLIDPMGIPIASSELNDRLRSPHPGPRAHDGSRSLGYLSGTSKMRVFEGPAPLDATVRHPRSERLGLLCDDAARAQISDRGGIESEFPQDFVRMLA